MKILQIIDSLEAGGSEKMAVNYANGLANIITFSGLVVTRKEGILKSEVNLNVNYLFLNKKKRIDLRAVAKLLKYCKTNKIDYLHAHSSSYFLAILVKLLYFRIKIIWHDHYGLSEFLNSRKYANLKVASSFFYGIIAVNQNLKIWSESKLFCGNVIYLGNFISDSQNEFKETYLNGIEGNKIVCIANLRQQKNHFLLLEVASKIVMRFPDWSFHIVGKNFEDSYSKQIFKKINDLNLNKNVFIYGSKSDIKHCIDQSEIAILTSNSEGLPVSLLEYGLHKKPVVVTNVGEIFNVIKNEINGFIVAKNDVDLFFNKLVLLIENKDLRKKLGDSLYKTIIENYSENIILNKYCNWITESK